MGLTIIQSSIGTLQVPAKNSVIIRDNPAPSIVVKVATGLPGKDGTTGLPSQSGHGGHFLKTDGTALSWAAVASGWGSLTGTLSAQTDLQAALDAKAPLNGPTFTGTVGGITKAMVGLGSVANVDTSTADNISDGTTKKLLTATERTKLAGIATSATANSTDAFLLARGNHTGQQTASTISDFNTAADARANAAIAAWVGAAPTALDTLNELATALGNDANFSTTVTNSLALKAPLASPTFTGTVTLPGATMADGTNLVIGTSTGTKIGTATTQKLGFFNATPVIQPVATSDLGTVLSNLGLRAAGTAYPITTSGVVTLSGTVTATQLFANGFGSATTVLAADTTLGPTNHKVRVNAVSAAVNITLPDATTISGVEYVIQKVDASTNVVNIQTTAGQTVNGATAPYVLATRYQAVTLVSNGTQWLSIAVNEFAGSANAAQKSEVSAEVTRTPTNELTPTSSNWPARSLYTAYKKVNYTGQLPAPSDMLAGDTMDVVS